jgi:hypothetical protein
MLKRLGEQRRQRARIEHERVDDAYARLHRRLHRLA